MITIVALALKSTLIIGGALLLCRLRCWSAAERHLLLLLSMAGLPLLVLLEQMPDRSVTVAAPELLSTWELSWDVPAFPSQTVEAEHSAPARLSIKTGATASYFLGAVGFVALWLIRVLNTGRWIGRTRPAPSDHAPEGCTVPLRVSRNIGSPVTWGVLAPEIVLPESWSEWSVEKRQAVLAHELAHVRRRDTLTSMLSGLVCCLFWIHPLAWMAHRRIRMEAERACDDAVLERGFSPIDYAELLLEIARGRDIGAALAIVSPSTLPTRIHALLNPSLRRTPMNRIRTYAIAALAFATVAPLASIEAVGKPEAHPPLSTADTDLSPTVKVGAVYPKEARDRNIEGHVLVEFTVTETGETADAKVILADPPGVFETAALQAVDRYRYRPRVIDGEPVAVTGVRNRIVFDLGGTGDPQKEPGSSPPPMSEDTYSKLTALQSLIDAQDYEAARSLIEHLQDDAHRLNDNELAQVHNVAGFVAFSTDDYWGAVTEYEQVLAQGDAVPRGLRTQTLYTLAQLSYVNEEYHAALQHIQQWMREAQNPAPTAQVFMAQVNHQLNDYPTAIEHLEAGLDEARERDVEIRENWWALLAYLYYEEEQWDEAASVLEILNREFPDEKYSKQLRHVRAMLADQHGGEA